MDTIDHPVFGRLTWNNEVETWEGKCSLGTSIVELWVHSNAYFTGVAGNREIDESCEQILSNVQSRHAEYVTKAIAYVQSELPHWFDSKEELKTQSLIQHMRIETVQIRPRGGASLWFHGPDTIYESGHVIEGTVELDGSLVQFDLQG